MPLKRPQNAEQRRLNAHGAKRANWKQWGPYLAERAWGTVREDYSTDGNAWAYFPHDHARSRTYRWNEDALAGFCDRNQYLCFGIALWNGQDPYLKERLFGLSGPEGNHGEDVKELYWYEESTPTHSFASMRYYYPQSEFPYEKLRIENAARGYTDREYEISDTGVFADNRYFDVKVTYAKATGEDILISITVTNRASGSAPVSLIPQLWFRNTWSWGYAQGPMNDVDSMPEIVTEKHEHLGSSLLAQHPALGDYHLYWQGRPEVMITNNETNFHNLYGSQNNTVYVKDAFHEYVINKNTDAINPAQRGTKAGLLYQTTLAAGASRTFQLRLCKTAKPRPFVGFKPTLHKREKELNTYYGDIQSPALPKDLLQVQRQALAGMLWSKQLYYYDVKQWHEGDPNTVLHRSHERNVHWQHMHNFDVMSMPDKWEYPWYAVWDTAFHTLPLAMVDTDYAKRQLTLITREWYMHPNGQLPAYEWAYGDVNPPVHAWAAWNVYMMAQAHTEADRPFLEAIFQKLLLNFTWWVNRKDTQGNSIFEGGFLGLDNISIFDRSEEPPTGGVLNQSDGTGWMGFFSQCMLTIALELARENSVYEEMASKFLEHYLQIAYAINGDDKHPGLWDETDGFFYDRLDLPDGRQTPIKVRSLVGLMPLIAVSIIDDEVYEKFPDFTRRMRWVMEHRPELAGSIANLEASGVERHHLLSFMDRYKLTRVLTYLLDEDEFLSDYGIRSLSKIHKDHPFSYTTDKGTVLTISYEPGEGETDLFGGNSNWRGPIWFPINYLIIESLRRYHAFYGDSFTIECPLGSENIMNLDQVADHITQRLIRLFKQDEKNGHAWCGSNAELKTAANEGLHQFFEYFNGDTGEGLGASHQTGWTGLIALLMQQAYPSR
ncbi:MAG: glucosidase [Granulosicoccus sp.]